MGDTVAHASRAPEDQQDPDSGKDRSSRDRGGRDRDKDRSGGGGGGKGCVNRTHDSDTDVDNPAKQNGEALSVENNSPDVEQSLTTMEGDAKRQEGDGGSGGGGGGHDTARADTLTGNPPTSSTHLAPENDKSVDEDLSLSLKDGSSENISSIEIDTSLGNDLPFSANHTIAGDDTSPETETGLEIGPEEGRMNNSDSLNEIHSPGSSVDNLTCDKSLTESGFVEESTSSLDHTSQSAAAHPESHIDKEAVPCGNTSLPSSTSTDSGIFPASTKSTVS
ncbi:hypothetical protein ACOMHN_001613 [Nucella lapillus]